MDQLQNENCCTCNNTTENKITKEIICEVFNIPLNLYEYSTMRYGCNSYVKDVKKMPELPKDYQFDSKKYMLWDTQYSEKNAQFSATLIGERVPKSNPKILKMDDGRSSIFGVYVRKEMHDG